MDPQETFGTIYRIAASHSGKVFDFASVLDNRYHPPFQPGDPLVARGIRQLIQFRDHEGGNQRFLLFPQDDSAYAIASSDSGAVFDIAFASGDERVPCIEFGYHGGPNQSFLLDPNADGTHVIRPKHSGLVLDVFGESRDDRARVFQHHFKDQGNQKFVFERVGTYALPPEGTVGNPGVPPPVTSIDANAPVATEPALIGQVRLPYFVVGDALSRVAAIRQTPYYRLTRHQFWAKVAQFNFAGPAQTRELSVVTGLTREESVQMQEATGLAITAKADALKIVGAILPFEIAVAQGLKVTTTKTGESTETTIKRVVEYKGGAPLLFVEYVLVDRYTLTRTDGVVVKTPWETRNPDVFRQVVFPPQAASNVISRPVKPLAAAAS